MSIVVGVLSEMGCIGWLMRLHPDGGRDVNRGDDNISNGFDDKDPFFQGYGCCEGQNRGHNGEVGCLHCEYVGEWG